MKEIDYSSHPMIKFKVVGYRVRDVQRARGLDMTGCVSVEGMRRYQLGHTYAHKPIDEGVAYVEIEVLDFDLPEPVMEHFRRSGYTRLEVFMRAQLENCKICNPGAPTEE